MFYTDKRFIYLSLIIIVILYVMMTSQLEWVSLLFTIPGVLIAITFHEFAHAYAATKLGDDTPRLQDRLNLNPLSHIEPVGIVLLTFVGFGWGKPVEINPRNFDRRYSQDTGEAIVAAAGPIMNFILAIVFAVIFCLLRKFAEAFTYTEIGAIIETIVSTTIITNIGLGVFNLIPLPPLDGSKIFIKFLPYNAKQWVYENERIFYIVFLVIWITGISSYIVSPILRLLYSGLMNIVMSIFGLI